jgi:hypothetical protein
MDDQESSVGAGQQGAGQALSFIFGTSTGHPGVSRAIFQAFIWLRRRPSLLLAVERSAENSGESPVRCHRCAVTRAVPQLTSFYSQTYRWRQAHAGLGSTGQMLPFCKANRAILHSNLQPHARLRVHSSFADVAPRTRTRLNSWRIRPISPEGQRASNLGEP